VHGESRNRHAFARLGFAADLQRSATDGIGTGDNVMRKQYFFRRSHRGLLAWDVDRLVQLSGNLGRRRIPLSSIRELDQAWSGDDEHQTWRGLLEHIKLIDQADLSFPIILSVSGEVMDGMHRVVKAAQQGLVEIEAVQFAHDPEPDYIGLTPEELPY
jgi:hypothetical protein